MGCSDLTLNTEKGKFCFNGEIYGFALAKNSLEVALSSLKTKAWWDAQIYDSTNKVTTLIGADDSEITPGEVSEYKPKFGFGTQTNKSSNEYIFKFKGTECLRKSMDELNGSEVYALFFTKSNVFQGIRSGQNNIKFVKSNISVSSEMVDGVSLIVVKFTFALDFETLYVEESLENGFTLDEIQGVTGLNIYGVTATATEIVIDVRDCSNTAVSGLTTTNLGIYDITYGNEIKIVTWVDNGDGTYTGTYIGGTVGHYFKGTYAGPSSGNLYIQSSTESVEVTS